DTHPGFSLGCLRIKVISPVRAEDVVIRIFGSRAFVNVDATRRDGSLLISELHRRPHYNDPLIAARWRFISATRKLCSFPRRITTLVARISMVLRAASREIVGV